MAEALKGAPSAEVAVEANSTGPAAPACRCKPLTVAAEEVAETEAEAPAGLAYNTSLVEAACKCRLRALALAEGALAVPSVEEAVEVEDSMDLVGLRRNKREKLEPM